MHQSLATAAGGIGGSVSDPDENPSPPPQITQQQQPTAMVSYAPMLSPDITTAVRNGGLKRSGHTAMPTAHPQYYETGGRPQTSLMHKQQSLDLSLSTGAKNCTTPANYYTEIKSDTSDTDIRPPKITRLHSAPVGGPINMSPITSTPPVINFDFSKGLANTFVQHYPQQSPVVQIDYSPSAMATNQYSSRIPRINVTVAAAALCNNTPPPVATPPVYGAATVDTWKPLVKIDYSNLDLSTPSLPSPTTSSTAASTSRLTGSRPAKDQTKVPAPRGRPPKHRPATVTSPAVNPPLPPVAHQSPFKASHKIVSQPMFDFPIAGPSTSSGVGGASSSSKVNGFAATPFPPIATSSSCLDMDEDYDNI